ncbi:SDR family oxidoreductase [Oceanospirillum beijerinckii]|uniref:SDR family oxidoreductase n=1 Tax=Oceanospirillum beijerinckii TaxID=64976 RepID=UPI00042864AC|nr:NAD(P)H-binding protein [Oceanospirillum beijerinckii]
MKTIAIIGGTGMLGAPVAEQLKQDGYQVRILSRNIDNARQQLGDGFDYQQADIHDLPSLKRALKDVDAVHLNLSGHSKQSYYASHVQGTKNVIQALKERPDTLISMISSAMAYPEFNDRWDNHYKWEAEQLLKASGHPYLAFLPSWFMETLPLFVQKNKVTLIGPSTRPIHWVSAKDYAQEVSKAYQNPECRNQRLSIFGCSTLTMEEALARYAQHHGLTLQRMPAWVASTIGWLTRDEVLMDIANLMTHYDKHGEKAPLDVIKTGTSVLDWIKSSPSPQVA